MRELKFRAWDGKKLEYDVTPSSENSIIKLDQFEWYEKEVDIVEQYTGLTDLHGKEIYEGDIVTETYPLKYTQPESPDNIEVIDYWVVKWEEKRAGFAPFCNCDTNGEYLYEVHVPDIVEVEVVGNIHENPDLVGGEE